MLEERQAGDAAFSLLNDQPTWQGTDPLGFDEIAGELAQLVLRSRASTPFALGIEGAWGSGKSTLMERLRRRLEQEPGVATVTFNAWTAAQQDVAEGLVKTVLDMLDRGAVRRALRNERLIGLARVGVDVAAGVLHLGSIVDLFWRETAIHPQTRNRMRELVEEAVADWASQRARGVPEGRLLCVVIDDLDRCSPRAAMEVLEAVKLYLNVPGVVFVIGYDQTIVSDLVLQERGYSESIKGRDYLEKFIQIKYRVPRSAIGRSRALVRALLEASGTHHLFGEEQLDLLVERNARNPRRIKRFINDFVLAYGLDPGWREFRPALLIRLQLMNAYFEEFLRLLVEQEDPDPLEEFADYRDAREWVQRVESGGTSEGRPAAFANRSLFPEPARAGDAERLLRTLENRLPVAYLALADDRELCALVDSLRDDVQWSLLRRRLLERELVVEVELDDDRDREVAALRMDGLSVLWVDDHPAGNAAIVEQLRDLGAEVTQVEDTEQARAALARWRFDVLLSDIEREGDADAGLDALERFRAEGIAPRKAIFYVARETHDRAERATQLGAVLTSARVELLAYLGAIVTAPERRPFVVHVFGVEEDRALAETVARSLREAMPGDSQTQAVAADGIPLGDVLVVVVGAGWETAGRPWARRLRGFAGTGAPVLFVLDSEAPPQAANEASVITAPQLPLVFRLQERAWHEGIAQVAEAARHQMGFTRLMRGMPP